MSRPVIEYYNETFYNETSGKNETITGNYVDYPYMIDEEAVSLNKEVDVLRQAVYELKGMLDEVCLKDSSYSWCA